MPTNLGGVRIIPVPLSVTMDLPYLRFRLLSLLLVLFRSLTYQKRYKAKSKQHVGSFLEPSSHINEIMKALVPPTFIFPKASSHLVQVTSGPLDATFNVWGDFMDYKGSSLPPFLRSPSPFSPLYPARL